MTAVHPHAGHRCEHQPVKRGSRRAYARQPPDGRRDARLNVEHIHNPARVIQGIVHVHVGRDVFVRRVVALSRQVTAKGLKVLVLCPVARGQQREPRARGR